MKRAIVYAALVLVAHASLASPARPCAVLAFQNYKDTSSQPIPLATEMLAEIMNVIGLQANFELKEANVLNIEASISHRRRYILYNPGFIAQINHVTKDKWAGLFLLAHEIGHHLNGHTIMKGGSTPALELEADQFAGFIMYKLGATLDQAQEVMKYIARNEASATHPGRASRMLAIQTGWNKAANVEEATAKSH
jgi:Zn-dependent peptidase ImmA (M78 family)